MFGYITPTEVTHGSVVLFLGKNIAVLPLLSAFVIPILTATVKWEGLATANRNKYFPYIPL